MREWRNVGGEVWWFENIPVYLTLEVAVKKWLSSMNSSQPRYCSVAGPHRASAGVGEVVLTIGSRVEGLLPMMPMPFQTLAMSWALGPVST